MRATTDRVHGQDQGYAGALRATVVDPSQTASHAWAVANRILLEVMEHRRTAGAGSNCTTLAPCAECVSPHLPKILLAVEQGLPVTFVLPAFPGKSPNPAKVLGPLPDMAE